MLKRAVHPGEILKDELEERGVTPASFARQIDVPANRISQILAGKRQEYPGSHRGGEFRRPRGRRSGCHRTRRADRHDR